MKLERTPADKWFSDCVRIRSNWHCEACGGDFSNHREYLDCSHFISRGKLSTRLHPLNAFAHCKSCHPKLGGGRWGGGNVAEFTAHFDARRGPMNRHFLMKLAQMPFRYYKHYIKDMSAHYRAEFRRIEALRKDGNIKYQHFEMFEGAVELSAIISDIKQELNRSFHANTHEDSNLKVSKNTGLYKEFAQF